MTKTIGARLRARREWVRLGGPLIVGAGCLWLLANRLGSLDPAQMWLAFQAVTLPQWIAAAGATCLSFWALGRYDAVMHRHLRTGVSGAQAQVSGISAIALSQLLGLGVLTGTLARWRLLPGLGPVRAAKVTAAVAASFLLAWAVITALACLLLAPRLLPGGLIALAVVMGLALPTLSLILPRLRIGRWRFTFPTVQALGAIALFALIDTLAAATALHVLLPGGLPFNAFFPAFLLALGAGLLAGTPGGVGPFELTLLAILPQIPQADLMAAVLAFRLVYYAIPALIAAAHVLRPRARAVADARVHAPRGIPDILLEHAARAESGVVRQNGGRLIASPHGTGMAVDTAQSLTLLFDPLSGRLGPLLPRLAVAARASNRLALVYKCSRRPALEARHAGWHLLRVADEAILDPGAFHLDGARHRQLRRKLRQAERSGVTISRPDALPLEAMARLDRQWKLIHGAPRGLSTGRYCPRYLSHQRIYCAHADGHLVAFVSFHENQNQLCLDLMRHGPGLPDGTMHLLITHALADARNENLPLSLAAMPAQDVREPLVMARLRAHVARRSGGDGLTRFKESFAPRRVPLYMAASSRMALALGALDLALAMRRATAPADTLPTGSEDAYDGHGIAPATPL